MNLDKFNSVLKQARLDAGMTQKELAEGICTQAQISKLENGDEFPSSITLHLISKKLGVDADYFFRQIESDRVDYIDEVKNIAKRFKREKDYQSLNELVTNQLKTPLVKESPEFYQYLLWNLGICEYYLNIDKVKALHLLIRSLNMRSIVINKEREAEILNSIAVILNEEGNYQFSLKVYERALEKFRRIPLVKDYTIEIRLLYGASKSSLSIGKVKKSLKFSELGIEVCKKYETLYLLGELYYQKARCLKRYGKEGAGDYFNKSIYTFLLEEKNEYAKIVEHAFVEYKYEQKNKK
ncbi:transcriptional regulator [Halalkalibacillus sediminis]|uniref:Transcriptional regulator n=1 Tax=Halalkalibacillus sediminis TaxID=2018042 RepID=A0A2I0QRE5_9BACI|nr:helix-turn-helix domain-containing protein [Halalkalibacillus sediminis]PKR76907.1 transcriptional regulator [Halalkalibacillus sediminis]